jgi:dTDP-D-glucose 4,6-dehydratase
MQPVFPYTWDFTRIFGCEKIERELGWKPRYGLREGLADSYHWYRQAGLHERPWDFSYEARVAQAIHANRWPP